MAGTAEKYPFGEVQGLVPHPRYAALRSEAGLCRIQTRWGGEAWLATRYEDVRKVLAGPEFSRALAAGNEQIARARPTVDDPRMLISMDPPDHTRMRRLVAKAFTARRVGELRPRVEQIVDGLLDDITMSGQPADLAASFAWPLPMIVISEMLGVPEADREDFRTQTEKTMALGTDLSRDEIAAAREHLNAYLAELVAQRRVHPTSDLLSGLVEARDNQDRLSEEELVRLGVTLLISGHETTANQIGNFVFTLLDNKRSGWGTLVERPDLVPNAVEELLRFVPMAASVDFARVAREDVVVGGQWVRAGEAVLVQLHAANRDRSVFDSPEELNLTREPNPHLAFGHGLHHCLGAPLARLELRIALSGLLARLPGLRLAVPAEDVDWRTDRLVRGVQGLPVAW